jgi:hypothetical protein
MNDSLDPIKGNLMKVFDGFYLTIVTQLLISYSNAVTSFMNNALDPIKANQMKVFDGFYLTIVTQLSISYSDAVTSFMNDTLASYVK